MTLVVTSGNHCGVSVLGSFIKTSSFEEAAVAGKEYLQLILAKKELAELSQRI